VVTTVADVEQAYLNSVLNKKVYVRAPPGLPVPEGHVLLLLESIYGMSQALREFWKLLQSVILAMGFKQSEFAQRTASSFGARTMASLSS
jgi:hypothetical protein